jgi:hypothetical protein
MNTCETCRYYMASPLQEPCESCHWDGVIGHDPSNWKGPTNADRIRAMTDEELAEYHAEKCGCPHDPIVFGCRMATIGCIGCWLEYLKQEAKE